MRLFGELTKVEPQDDGTVKVYGIASSGARDSAGEIILPDAMKAAIPDYMAFGALREMHQPHSAAGTALECSVDADGITQFAAHVVDPLAIKKVQTGVYKGFSVGGKVLGRDPTDRTIITKIRLSEVSLVDRPCNNDATLNLWKADIADPEGDPMSEPRQPTNDEVKAHAAELAKAAGKPDRPQDFLAKAREELVARGLSVVEAPAVDPAASAPVSPSIDETVQAADATAKPAETPPVAKVDPAAALGKALEQAQATAAPPSAVTPGLADLGKGLAKLGELYGEDPLRKGFWCISSLAEAVQTLCSVQRMATYEGTPASGDKQGPQMLAEAAQAAGQALMQYVKETLADAMAEMQAGGAELVLELVDGDEVIALAAAAVDLVKADAVLMEKAGKRNSARDQKHVQDAHDSAMKAGAKCNPANCPDEAGKVAGGDDLAKVAADRDRFAEALEKAVPAVEELKKRLDDQAKEIELLKSQPLPPRTAGSSMAVGQLIEKVQDAKGAGATGGGADLSEDDVQKALDAMPADQRADLLMRAALSRPVAISR